MRRLCHFVAHVACTSLVVLVALAAFQRPDAEGQGCVSHPTLSSNCIGDVNADGALNIGDPVYLLTHLFQGGPAPAANALAVDSPADALTQEQVDLLVDVLGHLSVEQLDDGTGTGTTNKTVRLTGVNLQLVNGLGTTSGAPVPYSPNGITNGVGNLIVGYNEFSNQTPNANLRTGSHNLLLGVGNSYDDYGCLVAGYHHEVHANSSVVLGGIGNRVSGGESTSLGGENCVLEAGRACIVGGANNTVAGLASTVIGAESSDTTVGATRSLVLGGVSNDGQGSNSVVVGGRSNRAAGPRRWRSVAMAMTPLVRSPSWLVASGTTYSERSLSWSGALVTSLTA